MLVTYNLGRVADVMQANTGLGCPSNTLSLRLVPNISLALICSF
jgi:hypothetical protein